MVNPHIKNVIFREQSLLMTRAVQMGGGHKFHCKQIEGGQNFGYVSLLVRKMEKHRA